MTEAVTTAPDAIPATYAGDVATLNPDTHILLNAHRVPYSVQAAMAKEGYTTIADIADRWLTKAACRSDSPKDYNFNAGENGFDEKTSLRTAIRLSQAVEAAQGRTLQVNKQMASDTVPDSQVHIVPGQRAQLELQYSKKTGRGKPSLDLQGTDHYVGLQYRACSRGEIGFFTNKQIIPYLPDPTEVHTRKKRRTDADGILHEYDEEERNSPSTVEQWKKQLMVFRTTLLMCIWAFPQYKQFDLTERDLDDFYDFFLGPDIAGRLPAPPLAVLMESERKAWREITLLMHKEKTLKEALEHMRSNHLFWQREVYEKVTHLTAEPALANPWRKGWGKSKGKQWLASDWQPSKGPKGKGKGHQKKGIAAKGSFPTSWPSSYATRDAKGKEYCRNHILYNACQGGCGRSHQCPVVKSDGSVCNGTHMATACPNA